MRRFVAALVTCGWLAALPVVARAEEPAVPVAQGFVSDYVGVVDGGTRTALSRLIGELQQKTGAEIAVVVVASTQPLSAFDYAMKIAEAWKPGAKGKDNGVVFLVATEDREMFILTGYGVEGALPDGRVGEIRDQLIVPAFRQGDFSGGIAAATNEMARIIAADAGVELTGALATPRLREVQLPPAAVLFIFVVMLLVFVFIARHPVLAAMLLSSNSNRRSRHDPFGHRGLGGFGGGFGGGGFGGFGGGGFGGGGAGGRW